MLEELMNTFGYLRSVDLSVDNVLSILPNLLERDGFIIANLIDVASVLKERLNIDYRKYYIIGVTNPPQILKALDVEPSIGLLFPSNIVVYQKPGGGTIVGVIKSTSVMAIAQIDALKEIANFLEKKLIIVIDQI